MPPFKSKFHDELIATATAMSVPGKGLLAADESTGTIGKRLASINVENTETNRQALRELLFTAQGFETRCSGVILFEETLYQTCVDGTPFVDLLKSKNIIPGIKVDKGVVVIPGLEERGETTTAGLDGLEARCTEYYAKGARFAKWRGVLTIENGKGPSERCLDANCNALADYAAICQKTGLVPIVEPEILTDGSHDIEVSQHVTEFVLQRVFESLARAGVLLEGMILKPNMVTSGSRCQKRADAETVAQKTVTTLRRTVPPAVPGVLFLSGGQTEDEATEHLNLMNKNTDAKKRPWTLSFSYGRALQATVLKTWKGEAGNVEAAQKALFDRAEANGKASEGLL